MSKNDVCYFQAELFRYHLCPLRSFHNRWLRVNDPKALDRGATGRRILDYLTERRSPKISVRCLCEQRKQFCCVNFELYLNPLLLLLNDYKVHIVLKTASWIQEQTI